MKIHVRGVKIHVGVKINVRGVNFLEKGVKIHGGGVKLDLKV